MIQAVDLFCGVGGLTRGLERSGIDVRIGIDVDKHSRFPYEANNRSRFLEEDVRSINGEVLSSFYEKGCIRLLAGCAPCQPFSTYSRPKRAKNADNWSMLNEFGRLIQEVQPELISMENVPQLISQPIFQDFLLALRDYEVHYEMVRCIDFGVPQTRKRLVLLASKLGTIRALKKQGKEDRERATVRNAIGNLKSLAAGEQDQKDPLHACSSLTPKNLSRIRASVPGGTWKDWPDDLRLQCHQRASGESFASVYGRMEWGAPAPTITTQCYGIGNGRFGHPEQDRAISMREAALLQTFPRSYKLLRPGETPRFAVLGRLIGNAVPVRLAEHIGRSLIKHVRDVHQKRDGAAAG